MAVIKNSKGLSDAQQYIPCIHRPLALKLMIIVVIVISECFYTTTPQCVRPEAGRRQSDSTVQVGERSVTVSYYYYSNDEGETGQ